MPSNMGIDITAQYWLCTFSVYLLYNNMYYKLCCSSQWSGYVWTRQWSRPVPAGATSWHRELSALSA